MNCQRESLGQRGLADPCLAHENRIVLAPAQQHVHRALEFFLAADQRIDFSVRRALGQVDRVSIECLRRRQLALAFFVAAFGFVSLVIDRVLVRFLAVLVVFRARLRNPVRDIIDRIEARNALLLQKENRRRFGFMKHRDQHVAARDFLPPRRLHVQRRPLQRPLHPDRVARRHFLVLGHPLDLLVEVMRQLAPQPIQIGAAMFQYLGRRHVVEHREQQMLQAHELVTPVDGFAHRELQRHLQFAADHDVVIRRSHGCYRLLTPFPSRT